MARKRSTYCPDLGNNKSNYTVFIAACGSLRLRTGTNLTETTTMLDARFAPHGAAVLRISLGTMWIAHALLKLFVFTLPGTAQFFASIGLPGMLAYPVFAAELIGGLAILLGFHGRIASALLLPVMVGAALVHVPNGWLFSAAGGGWEYPVFLIAASLAHVLIGDGSLALSNRRAAQPTLRPARA